MDKFSTRLRHLLGPFFFIFMQFSRKFGQVVGRHPLLGFASAAGKFWIYLWINTDEILNNNENYRLYMK